MTSHTRQPPGAVGLYDPRFEHDACGVGMVARLDNVPTHKVLAQAIEALENLEHRGASGADPTTGDGAGILMQMPDELLRARCDFDLPPPGRYGVLMCFLPLAERERERLRGLLERTVRAEGQVVLGWREVPIDTAHTGRTAGACRPAIWQLFVGAGELPARASAGAAAAGDGAAGTRADLSGGAGAGGEAGSTAVAGSEAAFDQDAFERKLYVIRRVCELDPAGEGLYVTSSSSRTINYKGMLVSYQLASFYSDLRDPLCKSAMALVHSRFSTNTFPSWELAHPYRVICHNGEINTVMGNVSWMRARESELQSELFGEDLQKILPVVKAGDSDSATFDRVLELLMLAGRSLPHAAMMMIPEAHREREDLPQELKGFYAFHACLMEPWDGPASVAFTDGRVIGATLDRNGLRPGRWVETVDGLVVLGSEIGLLDIPPQRIRRLGRLQPGKLFLIDLQRGRIVEDGEVKHEIAARRPYGEWFVRNSVHFDDLPPSDAVTISSQPLHTRQRAFGYSQEDLRVLLTPMARDGQEPIGSMGNDLALAVLSDQAPPLFSYFKQLFAQVTNPPIDPIREEIVMSLATSLGTERNLFDETPEHAHKLILRQPILLNHELETLRHVAHDEFSARTLDITWPVADGPEGMERALERLCAHAEAAIADGVNILILSDRSINARRAPIPSLLAVSAVHHHLVREGTRLRAGIVLESGEPREVHHFATLIGYGVSAINPYLLLETLDELVHHGLIPRTDGAGGASSPSSPSNGGTAPRAAGLTAEQAAQNVVKAIGKGLLKTISKMGISTIQSYRSAQIFEAVGLSRELIDRHFTGTASRIGGVGLGELAQEALARHARAWAGGVLAAEDMLPVGGVYAWRRDGEHHIWNPETIALMQHAVRSSDDGAVRAALGGDAHAHETVRDSPAYAKYREYARAVNDDAARRATLRGLLQLRGEAAFAGNGAAGVVGAEGKGGGGGGVALHEVEPAAAIVRRFCTGAMSLGSISREAHETLAIAMNRLGGRSNTGEGGEDPVRFQADPNGDRRRSAIKQVASGRFGVTINYLVNADELQIKMAQGAKPGEGGQLPGHKVDKYIGSIRHTTPGVGLISPPPHHDIYSIEDLKQLIYDLRCANPQAQVSVKLVSEVGVGTVAAGVSKANADRVLIAGHDGGTGASPLSSIQAAGVPWEIGLAETQQTLLLNELRSRIVVQTDGQLKTGRDVLIAALLGADEMGFSTAPLIATGCIMMRACHLNTCPVGIATQDPELRKRFEGTPEQVVNFFFYVAEEVRELLASLGLRSLDEAIGRVDLLEAGPAINHWKARGVDLTHILTHVALPDGEPRRRVQPPPPVLDDALDWQLVERAGPAIERGERVSVQLPIRNVNRCVGGILSSHIARAHGAEGLAPDAIAVDFEGSAGQSFGGWLAPGVTFTLRGDANDYAGKGLSGGVLAVRPRAGMNAEFVAQENVVVGNTVLYGATAGKAFFRGLAGERFAVRNSGAWAVVEGVGDHGCEYMTGGRVVVLGPTGRNFAAGMSGGIAYVLDEHGAFAKRCNMGMVDFEPLAAADAIELRAMIAEHRQRTDSPVAARVLAKWDELLAGGAFVKVMPRDYRRVLDELATEEAQAEGVPAV
ncbi:MAG TPA: glutamate synthase-related protein [Solirubrobacteraceae bacterium]|jgi:glutamate synthase domain-containing protein 2/glutamate synthase domain-containing protein 1/glutamate synthase domain-containing protein 3|nr:glutamate synthase-related protein [Solirubrobacteraceae bacterium]